MSPDASDETIDTRATVPEMPLAATCREPCLVHIYPAGPGMARRYPLGDKPKVVGRSPHCDISLDDPAVSRRHAHLELGPNGYFLLDLQSTNGTFVNNERITQCALKDGDYLRLGSCIFRFLGSGNVEAAYHEEIYRLAIIDPLTQVYNKRHLLEVLARELNRSARYGRPLALVLLDIDHFKRVNDEYGHLAGDAALRQVAVCAQRVIRKEGVFARFGGEEFAVILPESDLEAGAYVAERIRQEVAAHPFSYQGLVFPMTISLGVAATQGEEGLSAEAFLARADAKLYQAKSEGRNRIVATGPTLARK